MNFEEVYDSMNQSYSELESIMGNIYQSNGNQNNEMIQVLGNVAKKMISTQISFVQGYAEPSIKDSLVSNLESKYEVLSNALGQEQERHIR